MRRVLTGVAAIALTCAAGTMVMAQTTTPTPQTPTTTNQTTTNQTTTNQSTTNSNDPTSANNGTAVGAPTTQNLNAPGMVPVHPPNWQYDVMARQYHWTSPPPSGNAPSQ